MFFVNRKSNIYFVAGTAVSGCISIITIPLLTWFYSVQDIAIYTMFVVAVSFLSTLGSMALEQSLIRDYYESKDKNALIWTCVTTSSFGFSVLAILTLLFYKDVSSFIYDSVSLKATGLLLLCAFVNLLFKYSSLLLRLDKESAFFSLTQILQRILILIQTLLCSYYFVESLDWQDIILIHTISIVSVVILQVILVATFGHWKLNVSFITINHCKSMMKYSIPLLSSVLIIWCMGSVDKYFLKQFTNLHELGLYSTAFKFATALILLQQLISTIWVPASMRWYQANKDVSYYKLVLNLVMAGGIVAFSTACFLLPFLKYIIHPDYYAAIKFIPIIMLYPLFYLISEITTVGILFKKKTKYSLITSILTLLICIVSNYYLVLSFQATGVAIAIAISYFSFLLLRSYFSMKCWVNIIDLKSVLGIVILVSACAYTYLINMSFSAMLVFISVTYYIYNDDIRNYKRLLEI